MVALWGEAFQAFTKPYYVNYVWFKALRRAVAGRARRVAARVNNCKRANNTWIIGLDGTIARAASHRETRALDLLP